MMSRMKLDEPAFSSAVARVESGSGLDGFMGPIFFGYFFDGLPDAPEARLLSENMHGLEERRGVLAPAHRDANRLKHLAGLDFQLRRRTTQGGLERVMCELRTRQNIGGLVQRPVSHRQVPLLWDEFSGVVWRQFVQEEEVGHTGGVREKLDAFLNERRYLTNLVGQRIET